MSAKGLDWALRLRADILTRIEQLREALADIEPLRRELARLEEQLKGVERLVAVYHEQLGYPNTGDNAQPPVLQPPPTRPEPALQLEAAFKPKEAPARPNLVRGIRRQALGGIAVLRHAAAIARKTAARLWLSLRVWITERFPHSNTLS